MIKLKLLILKTVNGKIGIKGTIETRKLKFFNSCITSVGQFYNFVKMTLIGIYEMISGQRGAEDLGGPIRIAELSGDFGVKEFIVLCGL